MSVELIAATGEIAQVRLAGDGVVVTFGGTQCQVPVAWDGVSEGRLTCGNASKPFYAYRSGDEVFLWLKGEVFRIRQCTSENHRKHPPETTGDVSAAMPGMIVRVLAAEGDHVAEGDGIVVIESMKMQLTLAAPRSGVVRDLAAMPGTLIEQGAVLARIDGEASK